LGFSFPGITYALLVVVTDGKHHADLSRPFFNIAVNQKVLSTPAVLSAPTFQLFALADVGQDDV